MSIVSVAGYKTVQRGERNVKLDNSRDVVKGRDADGEDGGMDGDDSDAEDGAGGRTRRQKRGGGTADTLESNLGELTYIKIYV